MDDLAAALATSFSVSNETNTTAAEHPRYAMYKSKITGSSQDQRRQKILERQKSRRFDFMAHARNLAEGSWTVPGDWESVKSPEQEKEEDMELEAVLKKPSRSYKNQLMYSEWLVEVPEDFDKEWLTVLCPVGKRCLVVASRGKTRAYAKSGYCLHNFPSNLPGGNRAETNKYSYFTVLDCIYSESDGIYYILDVMCWKGHPVYDSETEFRFYWLHNKIEETPEVTKVLSVNPFKFIPLPNFPCTQEAISTALSTANFEPDGLLFYHKRTHYTIGPTPLVVWLKPYMVPEIIGVEIPETLMIKRPNSYINYQTHITEVRKTTQLNKNPPSMCKDKNGQPIKGMEVDRVVLSKDQKKNLHKRKEGGNKMDVTTDLPAESKLPESESTIETDSPVMFKPG